MAPKHMLHSAIFDSNFDIILLSREMYRFAFRFVNMGLQNIQFHKCVIFVFETYKIYSRRSETTWNIIDYTFTRM